MNVKKRPEERSSQQMVNITNDMGNISITSEVFMNLAGDAAKLLWR